MSVSQRSASPKHHGSAAPRRERGKQARAVVDDDLERARRLLRVDEEERRRISLALHNSVTQSIAALAANLDLIEQQSAVLGGTTRGLLQTSRLIVRDCFRQLRSLTDQLAPPLVAELGLRVAVQCIVASFSERTGITVACEAGDCPRLPDDIELALLRVVEDCLDNLDLLVSTPSVTLVASGDAVELRVRPVRPKVAVRWQHRMLLLFGSDVGVRMVRLSPGRRDQAATRVGLIVAAKAAAAARI